METWLKDFAFGVRTLRKNPVLAITALVTLALGIGASTAIFSVVNAVLLKPMHGNLVADVRPIVLSLMGAVVFVLLIECADVANLILVRTSRRERELAVRAALGGSRARLVRQMLAETLVLSVGGSLLGLVLADAGMKLLLTIGPASLPRVEDVRLDPTVLVFTILAELVAAAVFGVVPALRASRPDLIGVLRQSGRMSDRKAETDDGFR